jgi:GT2 family glycosyltransferase
VELSSEFIVTSLDKIKHGEADALIGILKENQYNEDYSKIIKKIDNRTSITKEEIRYYCGGIFLTKKTIIDDIGVFDPSFTRAQDFDYTLRLSKKYTLRAIPTIMGTHHTIPYSNRLRLINEFKKMMPKYYGKVLRKNIQNYNGCISFINKNGYTKGIPILVLLASSLWKPQIFIIAFLFILIDVITGVKRNQNIIARLSYHYIAPIMLIYGFVINPNNHELLIRSTIVKILK